MASDKIMGMKKYYVFFTATVTFYLMEKLRKISILLSTKIVISKALQKEQGFYICYRSCSTVLEPTWFVTISNMGFL